jgi:DNA-binding NtrC family response regulator
MAGKARILIVDDNENMLETLSDILQEQGYETETAKTGKEAIRKAKNIPINIAIIDIKLPDITGIEVLQTFRRLYPNRKNIIITANATLLNTIDALNMGADAYIMKPVDHNRLEQALTQCLEEQQKREESITEIRKMLGEQKLIRRLYDKI